MRIRLVDEKLRELRFMSLVDYQNPNPNWRGLKPRLSLSLPTGAKKNIMKAENEAVQQHFEKTVKHLDDEVQFPFKEGMREQVPSNYAIATKRLKSTYNLYKRVLLTLNRVIVN
ncbi:hypothetical protein L596_030676 [Steinernema carpocapsae]|uniref:Uncharacterized protein n=1 Tax=Steinernema carpocapsae TaxID=34508 RepID=A0A4U5LQ45_STECR|nr:hypothetical protein L596_030676 [Steinernema carpocapsae]